MASFPVRPDQLPLTSGNSRVKDARKLARRVVRAERGRFLADGPKAVAAALSVPGCVEEVFLTREGGERLASLTSYDASSGPHVGVRWSLVDDRAMASLSDSVTPAGVVAVCRLLDRPLADVIQRGMRLVVVCVDVRDPGNAGTVIRCADAVGADAVVLAGESVDPHNPKTVRASVGSLFHVPVAVERDVDRVFATLHDAGLTTMAADGAGELGLFEAGELLAGPVAWLFGNEAHGLPDDVAARADHRVAIPVRGRAESLNLSTAAAVCLYASLAATE